MQRLWSHPLPARPRGLSLAREKGWLLVWDDAHWLYLLDRKGQRHAQHHLKNRVAAACCADDGSACVVSSGNTIWWLAPDLTNRWHVTLPANALAAALDSFGQYVAVSDDRGGLHLFNRNSDPVCKTESPRPLHHLAFAPMEAKVLASADYGFVGAFDLKCHCLWRDGLVAHVGALTVAANGDLLLACFSDGLHRYAADGRKLERMAAEPSRLVSVSFDGGRVLIGGLKNRLVLVDAQGKELAAKELEKPAIALAIGPLGDVAAIAGGDGGVVSYRLA